MVEEQLIRILVNRSSNRLYALRYMLLKAVNIIAVIFNHQNFAMECAEEDRFYVIPTHDHYQVHGAAIVDLQHLHHAKPWLIRDRQRGEEQIAVWEDIADAFQTAGYFRPRSSLNLIHQHDKFMKWNSSSASRFH